MFSGFFSPDFSFYFTSHIFAYCAVGSRYSRLFVYLCIFFWGVAHSQGAQQSGKGGKMGKVAEKDESATSRHRGIDWLLRSMQRLRTVSLRKKKVALTLIALTGFLFLFFFALAFIRQSAARGQIKQEDISAQSVAAGCSFFFNFIPLLECFNLKVA